MVKCWVIVPTCGAPERIDCIKQLIHHSPSATLVVVLNTFERHSTGELFRILRPDDVLIVFNKRIGYVAACNAAWSYIVPLAHPQDIVCAINDDVEVREPWVGIVNQAIQDKRQIGPSVMPVGSNGAWGKPGAKYMFAEGWFWAAKFYALWSTSEDGNLYDPAFNPGYCEDMDLSIRIQERYGSGSIGKVELPFTHQRSQTFGKDREPFWTRNRKYLVSKWNLDAPQLA